MLGRSCAIGVAVLSLVVGGLLVAVPAYAAAPTITSFTPSSGPVATSVVLTGTGFTSASTVSFNGVKATSVTYSSATKISARVPVGATTGKISVSTSGGSVASTSSFTVTVGVVLAVTAGPPTTATALTASAFGANEAADVYFDTTDLALATTTSAGAISTTITIPASASAGTHTISVVGRRSGLAAQTSFLVRTNWDNADATVGRTGANKYENTLSASNVNQLDEVWRTTSDGSYALTAGPIVYNGTVIAAFRNYTVRAFSLSSGAQLWSHATSTNVEDSPAVGSSLVFVSDGDHVVALSAKSGKVEWDRDLGDEVLADPIVSGSNVYVTAGSSVYDLAVTTGAVTWASSVGDSVEDPTVVGGRVFVVVTSSYYVVALSASTGSILWSDAINSFLSPSTTVSGGFVYAGTADGRLIAMRTDNGATVWTYTHPDGVRVNSPAVANGYLYATDQSNSLFSVNASTGALRWSVTLPIGTYAYSRPSVADGVVYTNNTAGTFAYSTYGSSLWSVRETDYYYSPPVVDGSLIVGTDYGNLVRFTVNGAAAPTVARPDPKRLRPTLR